LVNGAALQDLIPDRLRLGFGSTVDVAERAAANPDILLTGTQVTVHNALVAALLNFSTPILLQGDAGLGKTAVLGAALLSISDPSRQIIRLEGAGCGMDELFRTLFTKKRHGPRWHDALGARPECRTILVADQAESVASGTFAYLDLLTRMPGRELRGSHKCGTTFSRFLAVILSPRALARGRLHGAGRSWWVR